jgi:hypothetical protein
MKLEVLYQTGSELCPIHLTQYLGVDRYSLLARISSTSPTTPAIQAEANTRSDCRPSRYWLY